MADNPDAQSGSTEAAITDETELWRRIPPFRNTFDENLNRVRPGKDCFNDHSNGTPMSVYLSDITIDPGKLLESVGPGFGVVSISAKLVRELNLAIISKPRSGEPGHAEVVGKKTDSVKSKLAKACHWVIKTEPFDPRA